MHVTVVNGTALTSFPTHDVLPVMVNAHTTLSLNVYSPLWRFQMMIMTNKTLNVRLLTDFSECNYSCPYCIASKIKTKFSRDAFVKICCELSRVPYMLNIRIGVAGEFFLSKPLINGACFLSHLDNVRSVNLITNLSFHAHKYNFLLSELYKPKLALVASFHPHAIHTNEEMNAWLDTAKSMQNMIGPNFTIALVAYPPLLEHIGTMREHFTDHGFTSFVQGFIGEYGGKPYPLSYTKEDKMLARKFCYSRHDYEFFFNMRPPGVCNAGYSSIFIDMSGTVSRCGLQASDPPLGNILEGIDFIKNLYTGPRICKATSCLCDTENMNTVVFNDHYEHTYLNQHVYKYRFKDAKSVLLSNEWAITY